MANDPEVYFFKEKSWEPCVEIKGADLIYTVPVASGHIEKTFRFSISQEEFDVLKRDEERRYFLYAFLHPYYQMHPASEALLAEPDIAKILLAAAPDVEELLTLRDERYRGAVSNLVRIYLGRDPSVMRRGRWFS